MKVLLIGGTGTISAEISRLCAKNGMDVVLLNRGIRAAPGHLDSFKNITRLTLDINDENAVKSKLRGEIFDVIVNFINYTAEQVERDIRLFSGKTRQYIFISTASAYQKPRGNYLVTESSPLSNPYWEYSRDKIACEERLTEEYRKNGFPVTIVRPSHTYDDFKVPLCIHGGKGPWSTLKRMSEGRPVLVPGDGTGLWPLTHSRDFAKGFCGLMGNIRATGEAVHITTDEALTWNQIYQAIGNALGAEPKLVHVSSDFIAECNPALKGPLHGDKSVCTVFDNSKIKRLVPGFTASIRFDQGVKAGVKYYLENPEAQTEDPDFENFVDAIINARTEALDTVKRQMNSPGAAKT